MDEATLELIGDVDGSIFWNSNFGNAKAASLKHFLDAYQDYLSKALFFRQLARNHLLVLLRTTLLDETTTRMSTQDVYGVEVTVAQFGLWLKRFGPLRETLSKAHVVSLPSSEVAVPWYQKGANRDQAVFLIEQNIKRFGSSILPHHLVILRYSSDPKNHFVVTCRHLGSNQMEHYPVVNSGRGYYIHGDQENCFPNLVDFIQSAVVDKLYSVAVKEGYSFPRDSVDEWQAIISKANAKLPVGHYGDRDALEKATKEMSLECGDGKMSNVSYGFGSLFRENGEKESAATQQATPSLSSSFTAGTGSGSVDDKTHAKIIGKYMLEEGLKLLLASGEVTSTDVSAVQQLLDRL